MQFFTRVETPYDFLGIYFKRRHQLMIKLVDTR